MRTQSNGQFPLGKLVGQPVGNAKSLQVVIPTSSPNRNWT